MNVKFIFSDINQQELIIYIQDGDFFISHLAANFSAKYPNIHISHASVDKSYLIQKNHRNNSVILQAACTGIEPVIPP